MNDCVIFSYMDELAASGRMKVYNADEFSNAVKSMIEKGLDSKCKMNEKGTCIIPPDTSTQSHTVDLAMVKCDCRRSRSGSLCKHSFLENSCTATRTRYSRHQVYSC